MIRVRADYPDCALCLSTGYAESGSIQLEGPIANVQLPSLPISSSRLSTSNLLAAPIPSASSISYLSFILFSNFMKTVQIRFCATLAENSIDHV